MTTYPFDQIAISVTDRVQPAETNLEIYVGLEHLDPESLKIRRWGSPSDVKGQKLGFHKGDIIFGKRRAYQRKLAVADFDGICSAHAMVLRPKTDVVLPEFLPFFMQSDLFMNRAVEISVGSLSPTINWRTLAAQEFPLPPLDEQRRIAGLLGACKEEKEKLYIVLEKIGVLRKSFLHSMLTNEKKGEIVRLGSLVDINSENTKEFSENKLIDYIDIASVSYKTGINDSSVEKVFYKDAPSRARRVVRCNDLLVSTVRINLRSFAKVDEKFNGAVASTGFAVLRPKPELVEHDFIWGIINSELFVGQMFALSTGTNYPAVSTKEIAAFKVPLLKKNKQKEYSKTINKLDETEEQLRNRLDKLGEIKQEILNTHL